MTAHHPAQLVPSDSVFPVIDLGSLLRRGGLICLVGAMSFSPRILLPVAIPGRQFDIRVEDLVVVLCLVGWVLTIHGRPRLFLSPLFSAMSVYVTIVAFGTGIAIMTLGLSPVRAAPFFVKEVEYFLVFLIVANLARTPGDLKFTGAALIVGSVVNAAWVGVQLLTDVKTQFFPIVGLRAEDLLLAKRLYDSYGPALIGESSPLATGGFFLLIFLLAFSYALTSRTALARLSYLTISGVLFSCLVFSDSRVAIVGGVIGLAILAGIDRKRLRIGLVTGGLIFAMAFVLNQSYVHYEKATGGRVLWLSEGAGSAALDRLSVTKIGSGLEEREDLWGAMLSESPNLLSGSGKGSLGFLPGLDGTEAHNHYLRVLIESGFFGVIAFGWLLIRTGRLCARTYQSGVLAITRVISGAALAATVALSAGALVQDVFTPVILNEVWWVLIGLTAAAYRIERHEGGSRQTTVRG